MQMCKDSLGSGEVFVRAVEGAPEPMCVLATNQQLVDIERFYTGDPSSVLSVDPTFNLGAFYVTPTTYHNLLVETTRGNNPILLGPILIHQTKTFSSNVKDGLYIGHKIYIDLVDTIFSQNQRTAITAYRTRLNFLRNNTFAMNTGYWGAVILFTSAADFFGNTKFIGNKGEVNGAIAATDSTLTFRGNTHIFENNTMWRVCKMHSQSINVYGRGQGVHVATRK